LQKQKFENTNYFIITYKNNIENFFRTEIFENNIENIYQQ